MKSNKKTKIIALLLCGLMSVSLFACDIEENETKAPTDEVTTEAPTEEPTEGSEAPTEDETVEDTSGETTYEETTNEEETNEEETGDYVNPTGISDAGAKLDEDAFALTSNTIDESKAVEKTAAEMLALLEKKDGVKAGEVYKVTGVLTLESDKVYYGNLAAIIAEDGVVIKNISNTTLRDVIVKGSLKVENSADITVYKLDLKAGSTGISVDDKSTDISLLSSIVNASETAIDSKGANISVYQSKLVARTGIASMGTDFTVQSTIIEAEKIGITSSGRYFIAKNNTVTVSDIKNGIGIEMTSGSYNSMAALNVINDVQNSITVTGGYNCAVELNRAIIIKGYSNTHFYVIKNRLGGELELRNNSYIIADGNTFRNDNRTHPTILEGNTEVNGDNMHDVNARLEYGADEELLPHTDVDKFTNMEVRTEVKDLASSSSSTLNYSTYVKDSSTWNKIVIVPPGVYVTSSTTTLTSKESNTDIYAYGSKLVLTQTWGGYNLIRTSYAENINISGFTGSIDRSTCGQVHVLAISGNSVTVAVSAGFTDGFYTLNSTTPDDCNYNPDFLSLYHANEDGTTTGLDAADIYGGHGGIQSVADNGDGTYTIKMSHTNNLELGDVMVTRLGQRGQNAIMPQYSKDIYFKDLTVFNISNSTTCRVQYSENVVFERYHSSRPRGYEITKEVFDEYEALEKKYGVDLGVYYDEEFEMYRGPDPVWGASSCMEVGQGYTGTTVISSLLHSTCDDGSNQRGQSGRLAGLENNGDGTYTVYYKGTLSSAARPGKYDTATTKSATDVAPLEIGNTIVAYTPNGSVVIDDAIVLTAPVAGTPADMHMAHDYTESNSKCSVCGAVRDNYTYKELSNTYDPGTGALSIITRGYTGSDRITWNTTILSVKIDAKYVNEEALEGLDLLDNTDQQSTRVTIDNVSRNSSGVYFDNTLIRDTKSRGILAKAKDVTIKNCTFRNLTLQAIVLGSETEWAEGTVARNVVIENNIFDNCAATNTYSKEYQSGYDAEPNICPIDIRGLGTTKEALISEVPPHDNLVANDFVIRNNKFINTPNKHMICVTAARDVTITGNIFEEREGDGEIIYINACYNVKVIDNKYTERIQAAFEKGNYNPIAEVYNCEKVIIETLKIPEKVTMKPQ